MSFWKKVFGGGQEKIDSFEAFWNWFEQNEQEFYRVVQQGGNISGYFLGKVLPRLHELRDGYHALVGMPDEEIVELVISANGNLKNMVFVEELVAAAPELPRWKFTALRPKLDMGVKGIQMGEYVFTPENVHFYVTKEADYPDEVSIVLVHDDLVPENKDFIINGTYVFLDHLLGEWDFATLIDHLEVKSPDEAEEELVPIAKLTEYLQEREKEFVAKYAGVHRDTEDHYFAIRETTLENDLPMAIRVDTGLQAWPAKASHPWMLVIEMPYNGKSDSGLPDEPTSDLLQAVEDRLMNELKEEDGYLNLGRESGDDTRRLYFACREFKESSRIVDALCQEYAGEIELDYDIYKDKYWRSFDYPA